MATPQIPARRNFLLALVGILLIGGVTASASSKNVYNNIKTYNRILANVYDKYVEEVDSKDLIYASIEGMMAALDPHSAFMEKKQYDDLMMETQGKYGGVGISIDIRDEWLTVVSPIEGSPAFKLGIRAGDRIVAIEGVSTKGITTAEAAKKLRGRKGTAVEITIERKGEPLPIDLEIVRDVIELESVPYAAIVRDGIGYVRLTRFSEESGSEVEEALEKLLAQGVDGLIFDLRWNHGGLLTQAVAVSDKFLDRGKLISYTQGRNRSDRNEYHARENPVVPPDVPLVVLVNGATASASEIVAGALQDDGRAVILGEPTYGKGLVQTLIPLDADANLKLTTAKWYTPAGRCIQKDWRTQEEPALTGPDDTDPDEAGSGEAGDVEAAPDAGGIHPDLTVEGELNTRFGFELLRQNHFFRFAVDYTAAHDLPRDFRATDEVLDEFRAYLDEQGFDYRTAAEVEIDRIRDLAEEESYAAATLAALDALQARIEAEKAKDFEKNRSYVAFGIEREIHSKVFGVEAMYEVMLRNDVQAQAAIDLLLDREAYEGALAGKEAVVAVGAEGGERAGLGSADPFRAEDQ